jgi:hypothetical protein
VVNNFKASFADRPAILHKINLSQLKRVNRDGYCATIFRTIPLQSKLLVYSDYQKCNVHGDQRGGSANGRSMLESPLFKVSTPSTSPNKILRKISVGVNVTVMSRRPERIVGYAQNPILRFSSAGGIQNRKRKIRVCAPPRGNLQVWLQLQYRNSSCKSHFYYCT